LEFCKTDFELLRILVGRVPWESIVKGKGVQEVWMLLQMEILRLLLNAERRAIGEEDWCG